jgi:hypothetical protein
MRTDRRSRRLFLRGAGGFVLAAPHLPSVLPRAWAAPAARRFVCVWHENGRRLAQWYPARSESELILPSKDLGDGRTREMRLKDLPPGPISAVLGPEFDPFRDKLLLPKSLNYDPKTGGGHNDAFSLCGTFKNAEHPSIDQVLAQSSKIYPSTPAVRALNLRAPTYKPGSGNLMTISRRRVGGAIIPVEAITNPRSAFRDLFGSAVVSADGTPNALFEQERAGTRTVVDAVYEDYARLRSNRRLTAPDRAYLEAHLTFLHELQQRLAKRVDVGTCQARAPGPALSGDQELVQNCRDHIDIAAAAIRCGLTNVATVMLGISSLFSKYGFPHRNNHHGNGHADAPVNRQEFLEMHRFLAGHVASLLKQLDVVEDPLTGATFLDNSLVLYANPLGDHHVDHSNWDLPVLLAGSAGGRLRTGRYIDYALSSADPAPSKRIYKGIPYNALLVTILQALGLEPADYEQDGRPGYGAYASDAARAATANGLPYLRA